MSIDIWQVFSWAMTIIGDLLMFVTLLAATGIFVAGTIAAMHDNRSWPAWAQPCWAAFVAGFPLTCLGLYAKMRDTTAVGNLPIGIYMRFNPGALVVTLGVAAVLAIFGWAIPRLRNF